MRFSNTVELQFGGATKAELLESLSHNDVSMNDYARVLFADPKFVTSTEVSDVRLAMVSLPDLGMPDGGVYDDILAQAASVGLEPCPLEIAPYLRLSYLDQPEGPYLTVASLELYPDSLQPNGFYLRRLEDGLWLRGYESGPENVYPPDFTDFVFMYPER